MPSTVIQKLLLTISIFLIVAGLALTIAGLVSPAWQVVDIREFRAEHQHGLWWDCIRAEKNRIDEDGAAGEAEHHRFWGWQKVVLTLILLSQLSAFVAICTGVCAPCFPPSTFCFTISLFIAMLLSMLSDGVFFFSANRVDIRFVTGK
uniref:Lipoma HMGIC fusion partner-like 2 protein n=1 Tax=Meloidogyne hapla TaxID=6305 RepID=A0A1I8BX89_MELHA